MPPDVVARPRVLVPNGALALESMVGTSWFYLLTLYFQEVRGGDAQRTGLLFVPMTLASVAGAAVAGRAAVTFGLRRAAMAGLGLVIAGLLVMAGGMSGGSTTLLVAVGMIVGEGGFMLANVPLTIAGTSSIENRRAGLAVGLLNTLIQLGSALGLAVPAGTRHRRPAGRRRSRPIGETPSGDHKRRETTCTPGAAPSTPARQLARSSAHRSGTSPTTGRDLRHPGRERGVISAC